MAEDAADDHAQIAIVSCPFFQAMLPPIVRGRNETHMLGTPGYAAARWNGHAPQVTTGVASASTTHCQPVN